ncbi:MAG: PAS domain S-box protein [Candidatus Hodarchaeales archaeon]|jgi:PAS domain S-box-containing protein
MDDSTSSWGEEFLKELISNKIIHILHIDNNNEFLETTKTFIENHNQNFSVTSMNSPEMALNHLKLIDYDIIICDNKMTTMSGLSFLKKLREDESIYTPFIMLTEESGEETAIQALNLGVNSYIQKTEKFDQLYTKLSNYILKAAKNGEISRIKSQTHEKFRFQARIIDNLGLAVIVIDKFGFIHYWNKAAYNLYGWKEQEVLNQNINDLLSPDLSQDIHNNIKNILKKGEIWIGNLYTRNRIGEYFQAYINETPIINDKGELEGSIRVTHKKEDIKDDHKTINNNIALLSSFHLLNESSTDLIYRIRFSPEPEIEYISPASINLFGYSPEEHYSDPELWLKIIHPKYKKRIIKAIKNPEKIEKRMTLRWITKNESELWTEHYNYIKRDSNNEIIALEGLARDITSYKITEEKLKNQRDEFSSFAHVMAHDLRNFLQAIDSYAQVLMVNQTYHEKYLKKIRKQVTNINELLGRSLTLADAGKSIEKTGQVDLNTIIKDVAEVVIPQEEIEFIIDNLPIVNGDYEKIVQIFKNLLENAVIHGKPLKIEIKATKGKINNNIRIINDGIPIEKEIGRKIFDLKSSFDKHKGGGLGMQIVKKLVDAHGWEIRLENKPQTTFLISIPRELLKNNSQ